MTHFKFPGDNVPTSPAKETAWLLWPVDPEAVPEPAAEAAPNVGVATVPKNKVGRPKKDIPCQAKQPAIHRFFGSGVKVIPNKAAPVDAHDDPMEVDDNQREENIALTLTIMMETGL